MEFDRTLRAEAVPSPTVASFVCAWLAAIVMEVFLAFTPMFVGSFAADFHKAGWSYFAMLPVAYLYFACMLVVFLGAPLAVSLGILIAVKARAFAFYALAGSGLVLLMSAFFEDPVDWQSPSTLWPVACGAASGLAAWAVLRLREPAFMRRTAPPGMTGNTSFSDTEMP
jgi:hypothetical protein